MFRFPALFFATALMTQSALAAAWEKIPISAGMHAHGATIEMANAVFHIYCPEAQAEDWWYSEFQIIADGVNADGPGRFHFENGQVSEVPFEDGFFRVRSSKDAKAFAEIIGRLKQNDVVLIRNEAAGDLVFSLQGASETIGECRPRLPKSVPHSEAPAVTAAAAPENRQTVADPAGQPQIIGKAEGYDEELKKRWLVTEQYLQALGFDPGPVDGVVGAETVMAVNAFQKAYRLEVANSLPARQFTVLEALAKAKVKPNSALQPLQATETEGLGGDSAPTKASPKPDISDGIAQAYSLRDSITENSADIMGALEKTLLPTSVQILSGYGVFNRLVLGSVPFVGCAADPVTVYGFYNVGQHVWLISWVDRANDTVLDARLSSGFEPKSHSENTAWYDLYSSSASVLGAMQQAVKIQTESFLELFPYKGCLDSGSMDRVFSEDQAIEAISEGLPPRTPESEALAFVMKADVARQYGLAGETELVPVVMVPDVLGFYRLSAFAPKTNPALLFVQGWKNSNGSLVLASRDAGMLIPQE